MKNIWTIIKKELKRFFTDRRTLFAIFFPGILLYVVYSAMGNIITDKVEDMQVVKEVNICIKNEPTEFNGTLQAALPQTTLTFYNDLNENEALDKVKNKELDLYVVYDANFINEVNSYTPAPNSKAPDVKIYYNSSKDESNSVANIYFAILDSYEQTISNKFDVNYKADASTNYDLASIEDSSAKLLTMFVPFLLIVMLFSSSMGLCAESIAGEKERGTIATLLSTPVKRWQIALGKVLPLGIVCLCTGMVSALGVILSLPKLMGAEATISLSGYGLGAFAALTVVVIVTALFFASLLCIFSTFAKSVKESTSLCLAPMMVTMAIGVTGMLSSGASTSWWAYLLPIYNSMQCFTEVISLTINPLHFALTIASNLCFIALCIYAVGRMFNNEKIMFSK